MKEKNQRTFQSKSIMYVKYFYRIPNREKRNNNDKIEKIYTSLLIVTHQKVQLSFLTN